MYIKILLLINLLSIINICFINRKNKTLIFKIALLWSCINLIWISLILFIIKFNYHFQFQFIINFSRSNHLNLSWGNIIFSIDGISSLLIYLSIILTIICIIISFNTINFLFKEFLIFLNLNLILLILVFSIFDLLIFYIFFESILIPIFLMIGIWGSRNTKIKAAFYFFFFTLIGSLIMLIGLFKIYQLFGTTNLESLISISLPCSIQYLLFISFFLSFSVKIPMIPFHIWLPQAHVEAPVAGSVLLAGILLKLGGYGFIRFFFPLFPNAILFFSPFIIILSCIAIIYGALSTCRQSDIKRLIAYSSVSHMGFVVISIFNYSIEGLISSIIIMIAHGLSSSGLFIGSSILYWRFHSRIIKYNKGLAYSMPIFSSIIFILILGNISFPLTINFIGEFISILSASRYSLFIGILMSIGAFIGIIYSFLLFNKIFFGSHSKNLYLPRDLIFIEFSSFIPLILGLILLGIFPNILINLTIFPSLIFISF